MLLKAICSSGSPSNTHTHTHGAWPLTTVSSFLLRTIADNQRCFSSYCVIVLSDSGRVLLQSTPATRPFSGMLMQAQKHNTIMELNSLMAHLLAFYMCYSIVIMMAYPRCVWVFFFFSGGLSWKQEKTKV